MYHTIATGSTESYFIDTDGCVWRTGKNLLESSNVTEPIKVKILQDVVSVAVSSSPLFLDANGRLWGFVVSTNNVEILFPDFPEIKSMAAGMKHNLLLDVEGNVWAYGRNQVAQLGLGDKVFRMRPCKIGNLPEIEAIATGWGHSLFLDTTGAVWSAGINVDGEAGVIAPRVKTQLSEIPNLPRIRSIVAGHHHSLFLDTDNCVWSCGRNTAGELGYSDTQSGFVPSKIQTLPEIDSISAGYFTSYFIDRSANVFVCGSNTNYGQLGTGDYMDVLSPTMVPSLKSIDQISGNCHTLFLNTEGEVFSCGSESCGKLGLGENRSSLHTPTKILTLPKLRSRLAANMYNKPKSARKI